MNKFYLCVFPRDAMPPYNTNGIKVLNNLADDAVVAYKLNGISELTFTYPIKKISDLELFKANNIVAYKGKPFRMKLFSESHEESSAPSITVTCFDFMLDLSDYAIGDFFMIGKTPHEMVTEAVKNSPFYVIPQNQLPGGMEWWDVKTDLELNRTTPAQVISRVMELTGGGEIYLDGYGIAIVKSIGRETAAPIRLGHNMNSVQRAIDSRNIITRVIPIGQDDLHIDYVTVGNRQYIDSRWAQVFGVVEGYAEYTDIAALGEDDPESYNGASTLYWTAVANMDAPIHIGNANLKEHKNKYVNTAGMAHKLDLPIIEYSIGLRDLEFLEDKPQYEYNIGDTVRIIDEHFGIDTGNPGEMDYLNLTQQVIEKEIHITKPVDNAIKLGQHKRTLLSNIYDGKMANDYIGNHTDRDTDIKEDSVEGTSRVDNLTIQPRGESSLQITDRFGVREIGHVYYDNEKTPVYAVAVSKSVIAMGRKVGSGWYWYNVIAQGKGNIDGAMWTGSIFTENIEIKSEDGTLRINGSMIQMSDNTRVRFSAGLDKADNKFKFILFNAQGQSAVYIDDDGNAIFTGIVMASKIIGSRFYGPSENGAFIEIGEGSGATNAALRLCRGSDPSNPVFKIEDNGSSIILIVGNNTFLSASLTGTRDVIPYGQWDFKNTLGVSGLNTTSNGSHNHGIPDGTWLATIDGGAVQWAASGAHTHTVKKA